MLTGGHRASTWPCAAKTPYRRMPPGCPRRGPMTNSKLAPAIIESAPAWTPADQSLVHSERVSRASIIAATPPTIAAPAGRQSASSWGTALMNTPIIPNATSVSSQPAPAPVFAATNAHTKRAEGNPRLGKGRRRPAVEGSAYQRIPRPASQEQVEGKVNSKPEAHTHRQPAQRDRPILRCCKSPA